MHKLTNTDTQIHKYTPCKSICRPVCIKKVVLLQLCTAKIPQSPKKRFYISRNCELFPLHAEESEQLPLESLEIFPMRLSSANAFAQKRPQVWPTKNGSTKVGW